MTFIIMQNPQQTRINTDHIVSYEGVAAGNRVTVRDISGVLHYGNETREAFESRLARALASPVYRPRFEGTVPR